MNLFVRLIKVLAAAFWSVWRRGHTIEMPHGASRIALRCWPNDLDNNLHMNNGRYLTLMDLGRMDLLIRSGLGKAIWDNRWAPMLSDAQIHFRREIRFWQRFTLESRIVHWQGSRAVLEQRFYVPSQSGEPQLAALALVRAGFYDRANKAFVPMRKLFEHLGVPYSEPEIDVEMSRHFSETADMFRVTAREAHLEDA